MGLSNGKLRAFAELLDKTAEKNPLLWLPCVLMLAVILGTAKSSEALNSFVLKTRTSERTDGARKTFAMRACACAAAAAFTVCTLPNLAETDAAAEESVRQGADAAVENGENDSGENGSGESEQNEAASDETGSSETDSGETDSDSDTVNSAKKDITVTLNCDVSGMTKGTARITTNRAFFGNSAELRITTGSSSDDAAAEVISRLGENAAYYEVYPFDASLYDADDGMEIEMKKGYITIELPIPKAMVNNPDRIKVYHIKGDTPEYIESEIIVRDDGKPVVKFDASEFSPYMFVAPYYEDVSSAAGAYDSSAPEETAAIPAADGITVPSVFDGNILKDLGFSGKKRRYRILRKRKLDDIVFVY